jgi:hypothetical protein
MTMSEQRKIKLLEDSAIVSGGKIHKKDSEHTVKKLKACHLVSKGKAQYVTEPKASK